MYIVTTGFKSMGICKTGVTGERNVCVLGGGARWMCVFLPSRHLCLLLIDIVSKAAYKKSNKK